MAKKIDMKALMAKNLQTSVQKPVSRIEENKNLENIQIQENKYTTKQDNNIPLEQETKNSTLLDNFDSSKEESNNSSKEENNNSLVQENKNSSKDENNSSSVQENKNTRIVDFVLSSKEESDKEENKEPLIQDLKNTSKKEFKDLERIQIQENNNSSIKDFSNGRNEENKKYRKEEIKKTSKQGIKETNILENEIKDNQAIQEENNTSKPVSSFSLQEETEALKDIKSMYAQAKVDNKPTKGLAVSITWDLYDEFIKVKNLINRQGDRVTLQELTHKAIEDYIKKFNI